MAEESYKPGAKCKFYGECTLYNHGVLSNEAEIKMCGRSRPINESYLPQLPKQCEYIPSQQYGGAFTCPGGTCDAFLRYIYAELVAEIREHTDDISKLFDKHLNLYGHW